MVHTHIIVSDAFQEMRGTRFMSSQMEQRETQCTMSQHNGNPNLLFGKLDPSHSRDMSQKAIWVLNLLKTLSAQVCNLN